MKIGLVPTLNPSFGGSYQYALAMLDAAIELSREQSDDNSYALFVRSNDRLALESLEPIHGIQIVSDDARSQTFPELVTAWAGDSGISSAIRKLCPPSVRKRIREARQTNRCADLNEQLRRQEIDWVLSTAPDAAIVEAGLPFVMPIFDLQHRLQPEFPEVSAHGEWDELEYLYRNGTRQATLILADSEVGKEDILTCYGSYGVTPDRIKVLPYVPAPYLSTEVPLSERAGVRSRYRLPERFLFYPAQLWPHKNHVRLVQALGLLKETRGSEIPLVLCGSASGRIRQHVFDEMMREAHRVRVAAQIHYLGYVPNEEMSALYAEATGLVMPTFFGPTNIPITEAWLFGCPVLTSDLRGIREQVGEAGLLVDPRSVEAMAEGIRRLWDDAGFRAELAQRGRQRVAAYSRADFRATLAEIIAEVNHRLMEQRSGSQVHEKESRLVLA